MYETDLAVFYCICNGKTVVNVWC